MADSLEEVHPPGRESELMGRNGHYPVSGPLSSLDAAGKQDRSGGQLPPFALGLVGVLVIVSCLGLGTIVTINLLSFQNSLHNPQTTVDDFYGALQSNRYQTAYDQLSSSYKNRLSASSFQAAFELSGTIKNYQVSNVQTQNSQASAVVKVALVKPDGGTPVDETKQVELVDEDGDWKIDRVDPTLTRVIWPWMVADVLCNMPMS
jgi:hypothetical protein